MRLVVAVVASLVLAGCLQAGPLAGNQGVHGTAMEGPTCPVEQNPPNGSCDDRPYQGGLAVTSGDGSRVVATFHTAADGTFNVTLAPGTYAIGNPPGSSGPPTCSSDGTFVVTGGSWTLANVSCDTGIR